MICKAKRIDDDEWVEGFYFERKGVDENIIEAFILQDDMNVFRVNPSTVKSYAGLVYENGRKVFNGDMVKRRNGKGEIDTYVVLITPLTIRCEDIENVMMLNEDKIEKLR